MHKYRITMTLSLVMAAALIIPGAAAAQNAAALAHQPFAAEALPAPGAPLPIEVTLLNSKESDLKLRMLLARDGKLMDVVFRDVTADLHDRPMFVTTINAPLAELSYQFYLYRQEELVAVSDRYFVRRSCLPDVQPADPSLRLENGRKRLDALRDTASRLQSEVQNYESILHLVEELESLTARPQEDNNES